MAFVHCPACGSEILDLEDAIMAETDGMRNLQRRLLYYLVEKEQKELQNLDMADDHRICKALAACYELHDYLAGRIISDDIDC